MAESQLEESMHLQIFLSPRLGRKTPMRVGYLSPFLEAEDTKAPIYSSLPHLNLTYGFSLISALQIYEPFFLLVGIFLLIRFLVDPSSCGVLICGSLQLI